MRKAFVRFVIKIRKKQEINWTERAEALDKLLNKYKSKKEKYDCIVPFSGGKDSTFALWYLVDQKKKSILWL